MLPLSSHNRSIFLSTLLCFLLLLPCDYITAEEALDVDNGTQTLPAEIIPSKYLIIPRVGNYRRGLLHQDPIEASLAKTGWIPPKAGDKVLSSVGIEVQWREANAETDNRIYAGGYAATTFESETARTMMMESSGCAAVWLNGQWHVGNPYGLNNQASVVPIQQGKNHLVIHLANPKERPKFFKPESDLIINSSLLPDVVVLESEEGNTILPGPGSLRITNASDESVKDLLLVAEVEGFDPIKTRINYLPGLMTISTPFKLPSGSIESSVKEKLGIKIQLLKEPEKNKDKEETSEEEILATFETSLNLVSPNELRTETFLSMVDKSVQRYAYLPPKDQTKQDASLALAVLLHNAGQDCLDLLKESEPLDDVAQLAPLGRGLYGFDWEDWSADDVLEAMADVSKKVSFDSNRISIIGSGMGGHGALWISCTQPNRFASVSVTDGWLNLLLPSDAIPRDVMLRNLASMTNRRANASDLFKLATNLSQTPVRLYQSPKQKGTARAEMLELRSILGDFHSDFAYREANVALIDQIKEAVKAANDNLSRRKSLNVNQIDFISPSLETLTEIGWAKIEVPIQFGKPMELHLKRDNDSTLIEGSTENVRRLTLSLKGIERAKKMQIKLDGNALVPIAWPSRSSEITIERNEEGGWGTPKPPEVPLLRNLGKSASRPGGLKSVFQNNPVLVYGTQGSEEENRWSKAKAIYDAELFGYRSLGRLEVISDREFNEDLYSDRNVVCYGNFKTNRAARTVFRISQINATERLIRVGQRPEIGEDLSILMVGPRIGSKTASTALIGGTGIVGMRNTSRLRYFWSGVHYPDLFIFGPEAISPPKGTTALEGIRAVGYRGVYWEANKGDIVWRDLAL